MQRERKVSVYLYTSVHTKHTWAYTHKPLHTTEPGEINVSMNDLSASDLFIFFTLDLNSISPEGWKALEYTQHTVVWVIPIFIWRNDALYKARRSFRNGDQFLT